MSPDERRRLNQEIGQAKLDARQRAREAAEKAKRDANASKEPATTTASRAILVNTASAGSKAVGREWPGFAELRAGRLPSPDSGVGYGYCTDYVRSIYAKAGQSLPFQGNASQWLSSARQYSNRFILLEPSQIERVPAGAIAVWGNLDDPSKAGHVAIVRSNDPGKKLIRYSEANLGGPYTAEGLTAEQRAFLQKEIITANFNKVTEAEKSYEASGSRAREPSKNHDLDLLGFIVPR